MGDFSDIYKKMHEEKQARHASWKEEAIRVLSESGIPHRMAGEETIIFRESGKPKVDFYPSTGRWRVAGVVHTFRGGVRSFLSWYKKQTI